MFFGDMFPAQNRVETVFISDTIKLRFGGWGLFAVKNSQKVLIPIFFFERPQPRRDKRLRHSDRLHFENLSSTGLNTASFSLHPLAIRLYIRLKLFPLILDHSAIVCFSPSMVRK